MNYQIDIPEMPTPLLMLGQFLDGRYQVVQVIETGRSSQVCIAEDTLHPSKPHCLVKCYKSATDQLSLERARLLFHTEAQKLKQLGDRTKQVPQLLAYFEQDKEFYLVEELVDGVSLAAELQDREFLTEIEVVELLVDVLETLQTAHGGGTIHGDINPSNLIRRRSDRKLMLVNFALIKRISTPLLPTDSLPLIGTPSYMPAEQAQGIIQPNCDIYALGLTAIQCLTGVHPSELGYNAKTESLVWSSKTNTSTSLEVALERMVNHNPGDRYQSAQAVLDDLRAAMQPFAETDVQVNKPKPSNFKRWLILGGSSVLCAGLIGVAFVFRQNIPGLSLGQVQTPAAKPSTKPTSKASKLAKKPDKSKSHKSPQKKSATKPPQKPIKVFPQSAQSNLLANQKNTQVRKLKLSYTLTGHKGWVRALAFFPNGNSIVSGSYDRTVRLWDLKKRAAFVTLSKHSGFASGVNAIAININGNIFATGNLDKTIKLWDYRSALPMRVLNGHTDQVFSVAFDAPTGKILASASADNTVKLWDWKTQSVIRTLTGHSAPVLAVAISPNGKLIASGSKDKTIKLWNLETGAEVFTLQGHMGQVRAVVFSPDGKTLASGSQDQTIRLWEVSTGKEIRTLSGHTGSVLSVAFSADGRAIASGSFDTTVRVWDTATGKEIQKLTSHTAPVFSVAFDPKNKTLISGSVDKTIKVWR